MCWSCGAHTLRRQPWIFFLGFQEYDREGYKHKFRRKKQFNPETLKIHKQWVYHEIMFLGGGGGGGGEGGGGGGGGPPASTNPSFWSWPPSSLSWIDWLRWVSVRWKTKKNLRNLHVSHTYTGLIGELEHLKMKTYYNSSFICIRIKKDEGQRVKNVTIKL